VDYVAKAIYPQLQSQISASRRFVVRIQPPKGFLALLCVLVAIPLPLTKTLRTNHCVISSSPPGRGRGGLSQGLVVLLSEEAPDQSEPVPCFPRPEHAYDKQSCVLPTQLQSYTGICRTRQRQSLRISQAYFCDSKFCEGKLGWRPG
jgi:hypothetical protein